MARTIGKRGPIAGGGFEDAPEYISMRQIKSGGCPRNLAVAREIWRLPVKSGGCARNLVVDREILRLPAKSCGCPRILVVAREIWWLPARSGGCVVADGDSTFRLRRQCRLDY